jgi:hypothetical protein
MESMGTRRNSSSSLLYHNDKEWLGREESDPQARPLKTPENIAPIDAIMCGVAAQCITPQEHRRAGINRPKANE